MIKNKNFVFKKQPPAIKLIIIDLYGVMSFGSYKNTCQWLCRRYGFDYEACYQIVYHKYFCQAAARQISERRSFVLTARELKIKESGEELRRRHLSYHVLNRSVFNWALARKKQGYQVVLVSKNTPPQFRHLVAKYSLKDNFKVINTYYLDIDKKSPKMLKYILGKYRLRPEQVLMVDDQDFNLDYPKKAGSKTILYKNFSQFKQKVDKILKTN